MHKRLLVVAALLASFVVALPALADVAQSTVVSADPVDQTPHILDGTVRAIAIVGTSVVVGGDFTTVTDSTGAQHYRRVCLFAYDLASGRVLDLAPAIDGPVYALAPGAGNT